jgi:hypothetical protein
MASQQVTLQALGLNYSPNSLSLPQGSLVQADNVIIRRDNVIESRRGLKEYSQDLGISTDRIKQLIEYKDRILAHYGTTLAFDTSELDANGKAIFQAFSGSYSETQSGLRIKSIEANKNLYFTTSEGVKKISAKTAADLSTTLIKSAGAIKALDITAKLVIEQGLLSGFLPLDSAVAYRAVWGYKDANDNLLLGVPSNRVEVYNYALDTTAMDLNTLIVNLDLLDQTGSEIRDGNYATSYYTPINSDASLLYNNVKNLAIQLDQDLFLANTSGGGTPPLDMKKIDIVNNVCTIEFEVGSDPSLYFSINDSIELKNLSTAIDYLNNTTTTPYYTLDYAPTSTTLSFTFEHADDSHVLTTGDLYSANYRKITATGDATYAQSLDDTELSAPATSEQIGIINNTLFRISERLKVELPAIIPTGLMSSYITPFTMTSSANVDVTVTIPTNIDSDYFVQIYRTRIFTATEGQSLGAGGISVIPDDEMRLVYEAFPTSAEISQGYLVFNDASPEELVQFNTNLYTNPESGEGLVAANEPPPFAKDINRFKNVVFYANTRTKQRLSTFQLLGVTLINSGDTITIASSAGYDTYEFISGAKEITDVACLDTLSGGEYFNLYSQSGIHYTPYFIVNGVGADPLISGAISIPINILTADDELKIAERVLNTLNEFIYDFSCNNTYNISSITSATPNTTIETLVDNHLSIGDTVEIFGVTQTGGTTINGVATVVSAPTSTSFTIATASLPTGVTFSNAYFKSNVVTITATNEGICDPAVDGDTGFTITQFQAGDGEDAANKQVLLSSLTSAAQAIDQTAQSLVRVINKQSTSIVNAYYISGDSTSPGQINLEEKDLTPEPFYVASSTVDVGLSFNPDIGPIEVVTGPITGSGTTFTFEHTAHGLNNGDEIVISFSNCNPVVAGLYAVTNCTTDTFDIVFGSSFVGAGTSFAYSLASETIVSTNDIKPNRIYYSKLGQPEAVPLLNYFDISAEDKEILRIFPLRDTLFAFKQDGAYRISGEVAPFTTSLLDSSYTVTAPDSVSVTKNTVYAWTSEGITPITESGAGETISRPIDTEILRLSSVPFTNFSKVTWGIGYDSDSSYTVYTNTQTTDTVATIAFRHCTLTNTWTTFSRTQTCGLNPGFEDVLFMGSGEDNLIHKERKNFNRTDYADKDFSLDLADDALNVSTKTMTFPSVAGINVGDVITQEQTLTIYAFNSTLRQLDLDPTVGVSTITSSSGASTTITINTSSPHYLTNNDYVTLSDTTSYPSLDGLYSVSNVASTSFQITIPTSLLVQTTSGTVKRSYENTLEASSGDNMRDKVVALAAYLDSDPGVLSTNYSSKVANKSGSIVSNSEDTPTVVVTSTAHGLVDGRVVTITTANGSIPSIVGTHVVSDTQAVSTEFSIPINVTTSGGTGSTYSTSGNLNTFEDIKACYNAIISNLNSDLGVTYNSYQQISNITLIESVVLSVNKTLNRVILNLPLQWVVGPLTVYNSINCEFTYAPITFGDPLMNKQISETTIMFRDKAMTKITVGFSSDLKPEFTTIDMFGQGNGIFGHYSDPGFGYGFFGGGSNAAPFRTLVPAQNQRCRYLNMKITHKVAREEYALYGTTLTGNLGISQRAYR